VGHIGGMIHSLCLGIGGNCDFTVECFVVVGNVGNNVVGIVESIVGDIANLEDLGSCSYYS